MVCARIPSIKRWVTAASAPRLPHEPKADRSSDGFRGLRRQARPNEPKVIAQTMAPRGLRRQARPTSPKPSLRRLGHGSGLVSNRFDRPNPSLKRWKVARPWPSRTFPLAPRRSTDRRRLSPEARSQTQGSWVLVKGGSALCQHCRNDPFHARAHAVEQHGRAEDARGADRGQDHPDDQHRQRDDHLEPRDGR